MESSGFAFSVKWQKLSFDISLTGSHSVGDLKRKLHEITGVHPNDQKVLGISQLKAATGSGNDQKRLADLKLKPVTKLQLIGTPQNEVAELQTEEFLERERQAEQLQKEIQKQQQQRQQELQRQAEYQEQQRRLQEDTLRRRQAEYQEQQQRMQEEMIWRQQQEKMAKTLQFQVNAYSASWGNKDDIIDTSDKIYCPPEILEQALSKNLDWPLIFQIGKNNIKLSKSSEMPVVHARALEFTAPKGAVFIPGWMMKKLHLEEGEAVSIRNTTLEKGEFVQLQPISSKWLEFSDQDRKAILEFKLREYACLSKHDIIAIDHNNQRIEFAIVETKPSDAILISDSDLAVDILDPVEKPTPIHPLSTEESNKGELESGQYCYWNVEIQDPTQILKLDLTALEDLYISNDERYPGFSNFQLCSQNVKTNSVVLDQTEPIFTLGTFYVAVYAYKSNCKFQLDAKFIKKEEKGHNLKAEDSNTNRNTDQRVCENCNKQVSEHVFEMHYAQCIKRNFTCPNENCKKVMPISEKEKHIDCAHSQITCKCGQKFEQINLPAHQQTECPAMLIHCHFCPLKIPLKEKISHQNTCGSRTLECRTCKKQLKRSELRWHYSSEHGFVVKDITNSMEEEWIN